MRMPNHTRIAFQPQCFKDAAFVSANEAESTRNCTGIGIRMGFSVPIARFRPFSSANRTLSDLSGLNQVDFQKGKYL